MKTIKEWLKTKIDNSQFEIIDKLGGRGIIKVLRKKDDAIFDLYDSFFYEDGSVDSISEFNPDLIHVTLINSKALGSKEVEINTLTAPIYLSDLKNAGYLHGNY